MMMKMNSFPEESYCWMFATRTPLTAAQQNELHAAFDTFEPGWVSHGRRVRGALQIVHDRFIVLIGDRGDGQLSGCGIDQGIRALHQAIEVASIALAGPLDILYISREGAWDVVSRSAFRQMAREHEVLADTPVADLSKVVRLADFRAQRWITVVSESWHARFLPSQTVPS
jgi:hypothetical protein